ncbi:MAG: hypothetical protein WBG12_18300, partial [Xanthobacteraceae bacterium]
MLPLAAKASLARCGSAGAHGRSKFFGRVESMTKPAPSRPARHDRDRHAKRPQRRPNRGFTLGGEIDHVPEAVSDRKPWHYQA